VTSVSAVLAWDIDGLDRAADALALDRTTLVGLQDELDDGAPPGSWTGASRDAARTAHEPLVDGLADTVAQVAAVAAAVDDAAASLRAARGEVEAVLDWAWRNGYSVDRATGRVRDSLCSSDDVAEERRVVASETADRLRQALLSAEHADTQLAAVLDRVSTGGLAARSDTLAVAAAGGASDGGLGVRPAPLDGTPAEANAWWQSLSAEDQDAVLAHHPEWLGNTDGIPAGVRDRANRALIDVYRTELQAEAERLQAALDGNRFGGTFTNDDARLALVLSKIQGLDEIEIVIGRDNRQLLVLDIDGSRELMAAVAVGDVDSADHVAVFTPGLGTTVQKDLSRYDDSMRALWETARDESELYGDGGSVATVSWLGYEAPQMSKVYDLGGGSVVSPAAAEQGAVRLADFYRGVDASRSVDPHLTAVAHSYGSTTTGYALREQTGVDSAVIFGSPGMGISEIGELHVPGGQVFRIEARNDVVADLQRFGLDPSHVGGIEGLSAEESVVDGRSLAESTGHSAYLRADTTSQHNIAAVVAGTSERMVRDDGRGLGDVLTWPVPWTR
jgi:hypothetical protein